jgi:hypothetical protein
MIALQDLSTAAELSPLDTVPISQSVGTRKTSLLALRSFLVGALTTGTYASANIVVGADGRLTITAGVEARPTILVSTTLDIGSIPSVGSLTANVAVVGAVVGDVVNLGLPTVAQNTALIWQAYVSAQDVVTIAVYNLSGAPINPASGTYKILVTK